MNLEKKTRIITLDWDIKWKRRYYLKKISWYAPVRDIVKSVRIRKSATKGYHCILELTSPVPEIRTRFELGDDPSRIIGDILRIKRINNILWDYKVMKGKKRLAGSWKHAKKQ